MRASKVRVLVIEDYPPFVSLIRRVLEYRQELQLVCEAPDGVQGVEKAAELQPDLILLDIGLPKLDGMKAGQRIGRLCPHSKILFVSQESSPDIVQEAFQLGAKGYVVKSDVVGDLLPAVRAVLEGKQFVSTSLKLYAVTLPSKLSGNPMPPG